MRKNSVTVCGARGILIEISGDLPWPDSENYASVFSIDWERCKEFPVMHVAEIEPKLNSLYLGKPLELNTGFNGKLLVEWLDKDFSKYAVYWQV